MSVDGPTAASQQRDGSAGLQLLVVEDGGMFTLPLPDEGTVVIGRSDDVEVRVSDVSVSRRHAALHLTRGRRPAFEDLGSANGSSVRGQRVDSGKRIELTIGEAVTVGSTVIMIQPVGTSARPRSSPRDRARAQGESLGFVFESEPMRKLLGIVDRVAARSINVLIHGETGVGKDVIAERLHHGSPRAAKPFVRLNCASLSEQLLESELFGHERGAFTGATRMKPGLLESAAGGTVFLDEVGELPSAVQAKLLRVLEAREVLRVGGVKPVPIDVRFVAATNRDLERDVEAGRFRQDLYFRLNGFLLIVSPLRDRPRDIEPLARLFAERVAAEMGTTAELTPEALTLLRQYSWPGNVRELRNVIERAMILSENGRVEPRQLLLDKMTSAAARTPLGDVGGGDAILSDEAAGERRRIIDALARCGGNQSEAARLLGLARGTLVARIKAYGLPRPHARRKREP